MTTVGTVVTGAVVTGLVFGFYKLTYGRFFVTLNAVPGPTAGRSFFFGHVGKYFDDRDVYNVFDDWLDQYGHTFKFGGLLNTDQLVSTDLKVIEHILTRTDIYEKPSRSRHAIATLLGEGVLVAEGATHKKQRRLLNPAFGPAQLRELTGVFVEKSNELRDRWLGIADSQILSNSASTDVRIDVLEWTSKATLDMIGLAGFSYAFNALSAKEASTSNELRHAINVIFADHDIFPVLLAAAQYHFPILGRLPFESIQRVTRARKVMRRVGMDLVHAKKAAVLRSLSTDGKADVNKNSIDGKDILSLLVRANMAKDVPAEQQLTDEDVIAQIPTFLVAGHDTTASAVTWALHALSLNEEIQTRLRTELIENPLPTASASDPLEQEELKKLQSLPLLDRVVRETLRLYPPVPNTVREATKDDVIPLAQPFMSSDGALHESIVVKKGLPIIVPILNSHRSKALWGDDAREFRPDRWLNPPDAVSAVPGMWSSLLTFIGGPHSCIGFRFSLLETKILLHVLISSFVFKPAIPKELIGRGNADIVMKPLIMTEKEKGSQLPLLVTPVSQR